MTLPFAPDVGALIALVILAAYTVFGLTGFGSSITALPLLVLLVPLKFAVPMMVLLDIVSGLLLVSRQHRHVARGELARLLPWGFLGIVLGVTVLVHAPERMLLLVLGVFVLGYVGSMLWRGRNAAPATPMAAGWAVPFGAVGGVFTALYGTGGPIYTVFVASRVRDKAGLRATMGTIVLLNSFFRAALFGFAGLYAQTGLLMTGVLLVPVVLVGLWLGNRLHARLPTERVLHVLWVVLAVGGVNLIWRNFFSIG